MDPLVTIGMAFFNNHDTVASSVRSILNQTMERWELIAADDGSTDGSADEVRRFGDPRIRVISDGLRRGLASRLNEAAALGRGRYFARMDADDLAYPERLSEQLVFLEENREVDLLGTEAMVFDHDGTPIGSLRCSATHEEICRRPWRAFNSLLHPTWMGKRSWFVHHRFRPFFRKSQDRELLLRTYRSSRFACIPRILHGYRQGRLSASKILVSRAYFSLALLSNAVERRDPALLLGVAAQPAKLVTETLAIATGLNYKLLRHRATAVSEREIETWRSVWLGNTAGMMQQP